MTGAGSWLTFAYSHPDRHLKTEPKPLISIAHPDFREILELEAKTVTRRARRSKTGSFARSPIRKVGTVSDALTGTLLRSASKAPASASRRSKSGLGHTAFEASKSPESFVPS